MPSIPASASTSAPEAPRVSTTMLIQVNAEPWIVYVDRAKVKGVFPTRAAAALAIVDHETGRTPFVFEPTN